MNGFSKGEPAELQAAASALDLTLGVEEARLLCRYLDLLERWNATYNLTAVRDRAQMRLRHLIDCLGVVSPLRRRLEGNSDRPVRLLDVGSGAGLPGVVLAVMFPSWQIDCVDSVGKKALFIRQVAAELALNRLNGIHERVERLKRDSYDVVTARAFSSLRSLMDQTSHLSSSDALFMAMKGKVPTAETAALPPEVMFHVEHLKSSQALAEDRCVVWMWHGSRPDNAAAAIASPCSELLTIPRSALPSSRC